jgi:electron transfer flavoprotein beta subunit
VNILVFVKRVPDTESKIRIQPETNSVVEEGLNFVISPYDEYAMEEALRVREAKGGKVTAVTVGRDESLVILKKCLAMGADEAVLIRDATPETYDGLRTARIIAGFIRTKSPDAKLLLFGKQSVGADNSQVPAMVAELLGLPCVTRACDVKVSDGTLTVERVLMDGFETVEVRLPAVVTVSNELGEPRYPVRRRERRAFRHEH